MQEVKIQVHDLKNVVDLPDVQKMIGLFGKYSKQLFVVGGAIRDTLMGKFSANIDVDFSVNISIKKLYLYVLQRSKYSCFSGMIVSNEFLRLGTIRIIIEKSVYDITMFRKEKYSGKSRFPTVEYNSEIGEDVKRRDFTINALYMDIDANIYDPTGCGLEDLKNKRVRFVIKKSPERLFGFFPKVFAVFFNNDALRYTKYDLEIVRRITEDPLRIIRYIRMYLKFFPVDELDKTVLNDIENVEDIICFCEKFFDSIIEYDKDTICILKNKLSLLKNVNVKKLRMEILKVLENNL